MALSASELEALDREGYVVVAGALDGAWLARLRRAFDGAPAQRDGTQHVRLGEATPEIGAWRALERHPVIEAAIGHILGRACAIDVHGRNPLAGFGQQGLHADWRPRAPGSPYAVVTAIWMVDDFTPDNGATRVVPGSHRSLGPPPKALAQPLARHPAETIITGRAGSVLVFNGHLWHSGQRNASGRPRRAVQLVAVACDAGANVER
ncbi:MAG TPA: phytanoyl-CoA dioxygenase family protein [Polyangiaceae bacterium]|nr:phytanoyl-CoA dioxygenase family protein [Polyangiaceae bacterium]